MVVAPAYHVAGVGQWLELGEPGQKQQVAGWAPLSLQVVSEPLCGLSMGTS